MTDKTRWYAKTEDGAFCLTLFGKPFGRTLYADEDSARRAALSWDRESLAADEDELRFHIQ